MESTIEREEKREKRDRGRVRRSVIPGEKK